MIVKLKQRGVFFYGTECIVVIRGGITETDGVKSLTSIGLAALFRVRPYGDNGMVLVPTYLKMKDAVAVTEQAKTPVVNLAMAISIANATSVSGVPSVIQTAADSFNFGTVPVSDANPATIDCDHSLKYHQKKSCPLATRLLARPPDQASAIMISLGVTESGTGVPNSEKALAELKALRQAVGPLLEQKLTEALSKK